MHFQRYGRICAVYVNWLVQKGDLVELEGVL